MLSGSPISGLPISASSESLALLNDISSEQSPATGGTYHRGRPYQSFSIPYPPIAVITFDQLPDVTNLQPQVRERRLNDQTLALPLPVPPVVIFDLLPDVENLAPIRRGWSQQTFTFSPNPPFVPVPEPDLPPPWVFNLDPVRRPFGAQTWFTMPVRFDEIPPAPPLPIPCPDIPLRGDEGSSFVGRIDFGFESQGRNDDNSEYHTNTELGDEVPFRREDTDDAPGRRDECV